MLLLSRLAVAALGWAGSLVVARSLSSEAWGQFSFVFALLSLMAVFTDLGVGRVVLARLMDDDPDEVALTASSFLALRILLGLLGYVIAVGYVLVLRYPAEVITATAAAGLVVVFATPGHALSVLFQSRHRLTLAAIAETVGQAIQLGLTILAAIFAPVLLIFALAPVANEIVALAIKSFGITRPSLGLKPSSRLEFSRWWPMLREAIPLAIGFALTFAMLKIDVLMLSLMDTFDAVGLYSIGYKFSDMMDTIAVAAAGPVSTLLVAAWPDQLSVFRQRIRTAALAFAVAGACAVAAFWPSAQALIRLLYGERFVAGAQAAQLLVVGAAVMALVILGIYALAAAGKQRHYPVVALAGIVINVSANLVLIPRLSYYGAAIATVVTLAITGALIWVVIARTMPIDKLIPLRGLSVLAVVTAIVAALGDHAVDRFPAWWPVVSAVAAATVLAVAYVLVALSRTSPGPDAAPPTSTPSTVVFIAHTGQVSGAEKVLLQLVDEAIRNDHHVVVACPPGPLVQALPDKAIHRAIPPLGLGGERGARRIVAATRMLSRWATAARRLTPLVRARNAATIVNSTFALPAARMARPSGGFAWLVHDTLTSTKQHAVVKLARPAIRIAVAVSHATAEPLRRLGLPVEVRQNGVAWPVPRLPGDLHSPPVVGMLALLTPWKGQRVLLEAVAQLPDVRLELAGGSFPGDAQYVEELKARAAQPDLAGRVRFLGHVAAESALRRWDVVVSASVDPEAGPLSVLEAMSYGRPVIGTDHGGTAEFLANGAGLLVPPGDCAALAEAVQTMLHDGSLRESVTENARRRIAGNHDIAVTLPLLLRTLLS
jgi:O-antigen/teichoic acid export membrane protein/glycosyltransferase involved in cell wall biosynthesis